MLSILLLTTNLVVLGIVSFQTGFREGVREASARQAAVPDTTPPHVLRLVNNGTEIVLSGGFDAGASAAFRSLLDASPEVRTIDLNSIGGRVAEANQVRDLIAARHLATYVAGSCLSACTAAFLGGNPRLLGPRGRLGFHEYVVPGRSADPDSFINNVGRKAMVDAGVDAEFAATAFSTPNSGLWQPDAARLLAAGVATRTVDGLDFSVMASGRVPVLADMETVLDRAPAFVVLKRVDPAAYAQAAQAMLAAGTEGRTWRELTALSRRALQAPLHRYFQVGGDTPLAKAAALSAEAARALVDQHPEVCLGLLNGDAGGASYADFLPADLARRDAEMTGVVMESGAMAPSNAVPTAAQARTELAKVMQTLRAGGTDPSLIGKPATTPASQRAACLAGAAFLEAVSRLPAPVAGGLMRYLAQSR